MTNTNSLKRVQHRSTHNLQGLERSQVPSQQLQCSNWTEVHSPTSLIPQILQLACSPPQSSVFDVK